MAALMSRVAIPYGGDELGKEYAVDGENDLHAVLLDEAAGGSIEEDEDQGAKGDGRDDQGKLKHRVDDLPAGEPVP